MEFPLEADYPYIWNGRKLCVSTYNVQNLKAQESVIGSKVKALVISSGDEGITASDIQEQTGFTRKQVMGAIHKDKSIVSTKWRSKSSTYVYREKK